MFKAERVSKAFGDNRVLRSLDLEVADGSIFGLVGVNGAGKSTLLRISAGIYACDEGSVRLNGRDTFTCPEVRRDIALVGDELYCPIGSSVGSMRGMYSSVYDFDDKAFAKYAGEFGISDDMRFSSMSKGMKKRAAIVLALARHPKLLMLDEAYDGLEPIARLKLKRTLAELVEDEGITVIISSHSLKELEDICDSYGILDDGRMKSYGDLITARDWINRYQVVMDRAPERGDFDGFDVLRFKAEGRVAQLVIRGDREETLARLRAMDTMLVDALPVNFEEMFIYEVEGGGENDTQIH